MVQAKVVSSVGSGGGLQSANELASSDATSSTAATAVYRELPDITVLI